MRRWFLPFCLVVFLSSPAAAQTAGSPPWSGSYIGLYGGLATGSVHAQLTSIDGNYGVSGGLIGGVVGHDWQHGSWVLGLLADAALTNVDGRWVFDDPRYLDTSYGWLATLRGRVGHEFGGALVYATGGLALAGIDSVRSDPAASASSTRVGYALGAGVEAPLHDSWTVQFEYLFRDFGVQPLDNYTLAHKLHTFTVGLNRSF